MQPSPDNAETADSRPRASTLLLVGLLLTSALIAAKNPRVGLLLATDGLLALAILLAAALGGVALLPALRLGPMRLHRQLLFGAGLGLGLLALSVLLMGLAGTTERLVWIALLSTAALAGLLRIGSLPSAQPGEQTASETPSPYLRWLWLLVCPFLALTILVACVPPGYLWAEEGKGYDVLEYHLEMPKEYLQADRVHYAPHNVYANFPANVEMLYLLCMILQGDAIDAAGACKLLNAGLAILTVAAAWMIGRRRSPATGLVTAVIAAGTGWLTYLSGVAYVENGMLLLAMLAVAAAIEAVHNQVNRLRWCALAGLMAGFSAGCKYTAAPLVGLPLALALLLGVRASATRRLAAVGVCLLAQAVAFSPWVAKNLAMTGNPVFPLANHFFDAYPPGWGPAESAHFDASHAPTPEQGTFAARLTSLWRHVPADHDQRFGPLVLLLALWAAVASRRDPAVRFCSAMLLLQIPVWLFATHLYARFAVPLLVPLVVMGGRVPLQGPNCRRVVVGMLVAGIGVNLVFVTRLYRRHMFPGGQRFNLEGVTGFFTQGLGLGHQHLETINRDLPADARILMIGDAKAFYFRRQVDYHVVFNRNPLAELLRTGPTPAQVIDWLDRQGYTHVLVNRAEIDRLRNTYGFPEEITAELFQRLAPAGLEHVRTFGVVGVDLYRVRPAH